MTKRKSRKIKLIPFAVLAMLPASLCFGFSTLNFSKADDYAYRESYSKDVTTDKITNPSFEKGSVPYDKSNSLQGWSAIESDSNAIGAIINVGTGISSDGSTTNSTFSDYQNTVYYLESNPGAKLGDDSRILMINSRTSSNSTNQQANKGYRSDEITLDSNSYYSFSVAVKTALNNDDSVNASVYLSGITDENGDVVEIGYENLNNSDWNSYEIYVATGDESQTVTLDLYLGSNKNEYSTGAVFFDEIKMFQYSANEFVETINLKNYKADNYNDLDSKNTKFLVKDLLEENATIVDSSYNFNFEEEDINSSSNTLGTAWSVKEGKNGGAQIMKLDTVPTDFKTTTGYDYVGMDLSYDILNNKANQQALVLYSKQDGYISVQSKSIDIYPHQIYKITASVKVSSVENGSFTLGIQENENIFTYNTSLKTSSYTLQSANSSGITTNATNDYTNNYQTVEIYVKGHSLYKSAFNIVLSLGDENTNAKGCVIVDNIKVLDASYEEYTNASNKLELKSYSAEDSHNSYFNATESTTNNYPVKASNFTTELGNETDCVSGVINISNEEMFEEMYGNYDWKKINPGNPNYSTQPNNIYMMYNRTPSWQSLTSTEFTLTKNTYQNISFDLFTSGENASINLKITDNNNIILFEEHNIKSSSTWNKIEILLHTAENVNSNINITISLGTEDDYASGWAFVDNLTVKDSTESQFNNAVYKNDFTDYFLSFETDKLKGDVNQSTTTSAYTFTIDEALDGNENTTGYAVGGLVLGKNNIYGIENDLNILAITSKKPSTSTLKSVYTFDLESDSYYKLTFDLKTLFNENLDESKDYNYGASVGIDGFEIIKNLTTDGKLTTITIYLNSTTASTPNLLFSLTSDCEETFGTALLTNIDLKSCTQEEYNSAKSNQFFGQTVFQSNYESATDEDTSTDEDTDNEETDVNPQSSPWLLVGSIVMALAMIVAIVAYFLRKIKFKKKDKPSQSKYDRKISIDTELITNEAKRRKDAQLEELFNAKNSLIKEKESLEETHKIFVKEARLNDKGKITKETEKEFKQYSAKIAKLEEKLNILDEQIQNVSSPEYLINLEKEVQDEEEHKIKLERKNLNK